MCHREPAGQAAPSSRRASVPRVHEGAAPRGSGGAGGGLSEAAGEAVTAPRAMRARPSRGRTTRYCRSASSTRASVMEVPAADPAQGMVPAPGVLDAGHAFDLDGGELGRFARGGERPGLARGVDVGSVDHAGQHAMPGTAARARVRGASTRSHTAVLRRVELRVQHPHLPPRIIRSRHHRGHHLPPGRHRQRAPPAWPSPPASGTGHGRHTAETTTRTASTRPTNPLQSLRKNELPPGSAVPREAGVMVPEIFRVSPFAGETTCSLLGRVFCACRRPDDGVAW